MEPLFNMWARRRLGRAWLPALGQDEQGQQKIGGAKRSCSPSWTHISEILQALATDERSKNKTETEGHADDHPMGTEMRAVNRHQRHNNAEADKVNKNRKKDDQSGRFSHEAAGQTASAIPT